MKKQPEFKSERREAQRDRARWGMRVKGRPEYLRLQVGRILRAKPKGLDKHERMDP